MATAAAAAATAGAAVVVAVAAATAATVAVGADAAAPCPSQVAHAQLCTLLGDKMQLPKLISKRCSSFCGFVMTKCETISNIKI